MDLFRAAADNSAGLRDRFDAIARTQKPNSACLRFIRLVEDNGRISVNVRTQVLIQFLTSGVHQNIYEWARDQARRSSKDSETILRERLGRWYEARVTFDRSFRQGEAFRYGALNVGGDGMAKYGSFCLVLNQTTPLNWGTVAYLPGDSLTVYVDATGKPDHVAIARDVGEHVQRHLVAALKHHEDINQVPEKDWPSLLCSEHCYVEAIFVGDLEPSDVDTVRIAQAEHDLLFDFAFEDFSAKLSESDRLWVDNFRMALDRLDRAGVPLEVV